MDDGRRRYPDLPRSIDRIQRDVDDEIRFDLEMRIRELMNGGIEEKAAREQAWREFGDVAATRDYCLALDTRVERNSRWSRWIEELVTDAALAVRSIRNMPGFAAVVLLTLAVGIGANAAIYSVVRRLLVDQLPYANASQLVRIYAGVPPTGGSDFLRANEFHDLASVPAFDGVAAFGAIGGTMYYGENGAEPLPDARVTPNFFAVLGASPVSGRAFGEADVAADAPPVAIISYDFWERTFRGDPSLIGRSIRIDGGTVMIVGVMPRDFVSPGFVADLWLALDMKRFIDPKRAPYRGFRGIARLKQGASVSLALSQAATVAARWRAAGTISATTPGPRMESIRDAMVGDVRPALVSVMGAALLLLVIACTNVAGLFLARATSRRREMAVRVALGAGRGRLIRQLLTESAIYGVGGGVAGVLLAMVLKPPLVRMANLALPHLGEIRIDMRLAITALVAAVVSSIVFGVLPAISASRVDLKESMGDTGRSSSASGGRVRLRHLLVASQIALAVLLTVGAGLLFRSFSGLLNTRIGYSSEKNVLIFYADAPVTSFPDGVTRAASFSDILMRVRAIPGVVDAGVTSIGPWNGPNQTRVRDASADPGSAPQLSDFVYASDGYFAAIGTRVMRGRPILATDRPNAPRVTVLSETVARHVFGDADPIGKQVTFTGDADPNPYRVVGVAEDYRPRPTSDPQPAVYVSDWQGDASTRLQFVVRTTDDPSKTVAALRALFHDISPTTSLIYLRSMSEVVDGFLAPQHLSLELFAAFALLALTLAGLGVYAVMSYIVAARTRELGIRSALGARRPALVGIVVRQGLTSATLGVIVGLALAFAGARLLAGLLVGVSSHDALTFAITPVAMLIVMLAACALPAWRATRVDPVEALRAE